MLVESRPELHTHTQPQPLVRQYIVMKRTEYRTRGNNRGLDFHGRTRVFVTYKTPRDTRPGNSDTTGTRDCRSHLQSHPVCRRPPPPPFENIPSTYRHNNRVGARAVRVSIIVGLPILLVTRPKLFRAARVNALNGRIIHTRP